jgi:hypothetical protein
MKIGLFVPCYIDLIYPEVGIATLKLLERFGLNVDYPDNQTCCGQPMSNSGDQRNVAESGAVWLTQEDLMVSALGFLSQHLIVLLDPEQIVADMHDAYARVRLDQTAYGCFMMGPSATGDIEATMVHGAQGVRSLNVFFLAKTDERV